jgi:hypothetical protein
MNLQSCRSGRHLPRAASRRNPDVGYSPAGSLATTAVLVRFEKTTSGVTQGAARQHPLAKPPKSIQLALKAGESIHFGHNLSAK